MISSPSSIGKLVAESGISKREAEMILADVLGLSRASIIANADRKLEANLMLDKLAANAPLAISTFELPMTGKMVIDGHRVNKTVYLLTVEKGVFVPLATL